MNRTPHTAPSPKDVAQLLIRHAPRWVIPAVLIAAVAIAYAAVRRPAWEASQALIVRNEATNNQDRPGKFREVAEMKTAEETILELVRSRGVLTAALEEVGPPADYRGEKTAWPTPRDVAKTRKWVSMTPPKGAEFGKTEVFYLNVKQHDRKRAIALNVAICDVLQGRFQELRDEKAQSMIDELAKTVQIAKVDLDEATARLAATESQVGSELAELRALDEFGGGETASHRTATEIRAELREVQATQRSNEQLLFLLADAKADPQRLLAMPARLLESQPALKQLKDGIVAAQLKTASLYGTMSNNHPLIAAAKESEREIRAHLYNELPVALRGVEAELQLAQDREMLLKKQLSDTTGRLAELATLRAGYSNQVAETTNRSELVKQAEENLGEARAAHASAKAASLIGRIDLPDAGIYPVGPRRAAIAGMGILGGLFTGFGVLFLTVPPTTRPSVDEAGTAVEEESAAADRPTVRAANGLTFKEALEKIVYGSTV